MTQADKDLLLKDLCARLPYGVKCRFFSSKGVIPSIIVRIDTELETVSHKPEGQTVYYLHNIEDAKPYLRSMSSMTEEEIYEWNVMADNCRDEFDSCFVDYCNRKHLDYRGLIEKGLALEAPDGLYKTE